MAKDTGATVTPPTSKPTDAGNVAPPTTPPAGATGTPSEASAEQVSSAVRNILGLKEGQNLSHVIASTTQSVIGKMQEKILEDVDKKLEALKPPVKKEEPSETEALRESVVSLTKTVGTLKQESVDDKAEVAESKRVTAVGDLLSKAGIAPELLSSFRMLVQNGHVEGLAKPAKGADGKLVCDGDSDLPFEPVFTKFIEDNQHWLAKYRGSGTGARGGSPRTPQVPALESDIKVDEKGSIGKAFKENPEAATAALDARTEKLGSKLHMPQVHTG